MSDERITLTRAELAALIEAAVAEALADVADDLERLHIIREGRAATMRRQREKPEVREREASRMREYFARPEVIERRRVRERELARARGIEPRRFYASEEERRVAKREAQRRYDQKRRGTPELRANRQAQRRTAAEKEATQMTPILKAAIS